MWLKRVLLMSIIRKATHIQSVEFYFEILPHEELIWIFKVGKLIPSG